MLNGLKAGPLTLLSWFAELVEQTHNGLSPFSLFALMILLLFLGSIIYFGLRWLARSGREQ